jgi:hypothetical protein
LASGGAPSPSTQRRSGSARRAFTATMRARARSIGWTLARSHWAARNGEMKHYVAHAFRCVSRVVSVIAP